MKNTKNRETLPTIIVYKSFHFDGKRSLKKSWTIIFTINPFILSHEKINEFFDILFLDHTGPPPESYQVFIEDNTVATNLAMHYTIQVTKNKDKIAVKRVLGLLAASVKNHPFEDVFLHCLITHLIQMRDDFEAEDFCTVVFDEFFLTLITNDNVVRHLLRLLKFVHTKVSPTRLGMFNLDSLHDKWIL